MRQMLRKSIRIRLLAALLLAVFTAAGVGAPARADAVVTFENVMFELNNLEVSVDCGGGSYGEIVLLNGTIHSLFYTVENAGGGVLYRSKINGVNVTGIGQTSGAAYQVTMIGMGTSTISDRQGYIAVDVMNLIGRGKNSKAVVQMVFSVGVDADGNETLLVDHYITHCH